MTVPWRALAVVVGAPVVVLALAAGIWVQADSVSAQAEMAEARLAHALSRPAPSPEAEAMALLLPRESKGMAALAFQALVLAQVQPSGRVVAEVAASAPEVGGPQNRLHLVLRVEVREPELAAALVALEGAVPLVGVDRLDVQAIAGGQLTATLAPSAWAGQVGQAGQVEQAGQVGP